MNPTAEYGHDEKDGGATRRPRAAASAYAPGGEGVGHGVACYCRVVPAPSPTLRLLAVVLIGYAVVSVGLSAAVGVVSEPLRDTTPTSFVEHEQTIRWMSQLSASNLGHAIVGECVVVALLVAMARRLPSKLALVAVLAAASGGVTAWGLGTFSLESLTPYREASGFDAWYETISISRVVFAASVGGLAIAQTSGQRRRAVTTAAGIALLAAAVLLHPAFMSAGNSAQLWSETVAHVSLYVWTDLLMTVGLATAAWLAVRSTDDDDARALDAVAASGLRWGRTMVWWRAGLAVVTASMMVAGAFAAQKAASGAMFGGRPMSPGLPWTLQLVPWLGYVEALLGGSMVVGLAAAIVQSRSRLGAGLVAFGTLLLLGSFALAAGLNTILHGAIASGHATNIASQMLEHRELTQALDTSMRGMGLTGLACVLFGLLAIAGVIGHPPAKRAIRFMVICGLFAAVATFGLKMLAGLGMGLLLLVPIVLGTAVWALMDLTTFLALTADALDRSEAAADSSWQGSESPQSHETDAAPSD
ncbi:MAG: hypothetical protein K0V04_42120 [Deltaproteobacteria bacterium]|nr:hypothetical protein [Deltaproteobacteria bacterium]